MSDVIHIGEWQIHHKRDRYAPAPDQCNHRHIELDERGDIVRCTKCGAQVSAFWALRMLTEDYNDALVRLERKRQQLTEDIEKNLHLIAARKVESAWRNRTTVPACPRCGEGILPEDGFGSTLISRKFVLRRRASEQKNTE